MKSGHMRCLTADPSARRKPRNCPTLSISFDSGDGTVHQLTVASTRPAKGSRAFLPEEEVLIEAVGTRLSSVLRAAAPNAPNRTTRR